MSDVRRDYKKRHSDCHEAVGLRTWTSIYLWWLPQRLRASFVGVPFKDG